MQAVIKHRSAGFYAVVSVSAGLSVLLALKISDALNPAAINILALVLLVLCAAPLTARLRAGAVDPFHPIVVLPLAYFLYFGVGVYLFMLRMDAGLVAEPPAEGAIIAAMALSVVGILCFYAGYALLKKTPPVRRPMGPKITLPWRQERILSFILLGLALFIGLNALLWFSAGGVPLFIENYAQSERTSVMAGMGYLLAAALAIVPITLLAINIYWQRGGGVSFILRLALLCLTLMALAVLVLNVERGILVVFVLLAVMNYHYMKARLAFRKLFVIFLLIVTLAGLGGYLRSTQWSDSKGVFTTVFMLEVLNEFDNYAAVVDNVPERLELQYGRTLLPLLFIPIPRAVMPDKDDLKPAGKVFKEFFGHDYIRIGERMTLPGELYMNFHVLGVVLGMFGYGLLAAYVERRLYPETNDPARVLMYCLTLLGLISLMAGDFVSAVVGYAQLVLPVACLCLAWSVMGTVTAQKKLAEGRG